MGSGRDFGTLLFISIIISLKDGHNVLKSLSSSDYKQVLSTIRHCILATDLALFFPNKGQLSAIVKEGIFSWDENKHRQAHTKQSKQIGGETGDWQNTHREREIVD